MTLREKIEVMETFERGEEIEMAYRGYDIWSSMSTPSWNFEDRNYRIKPKPKQTVTIEKWLCRDVDEFLVIEGDSRFQSNHDYFKVKLLDTYEVEL